MPLGMAICFRITPISENWYGAWSMGDRRNGNIIENFGVDN